jgi:predicted AlkP superfamily phosphohydrolase/phosphomutase
MKKRKVLLIGWDSCEWKVVNDLISKGLMPTLQKFLSEASSGKFATLEPPVSPILWTSMATGKRMEDHGIHGFLEPDPNPNSKSGIRAVSVTSRKVKAIWNMLNQKGYTTNVIGWWPSHPAEPVNGIMVSNFYHLDKPNNSQDWVLPDGAVHPKEYFETFKELRVSGNEITAAHILPFIPEVMKVNQEEDKIVSFIIGTLAHTSTVLTLTPHILRA